MLRSRIVKAVTASLCVSGLALALPTVSNATIGQHITSKYVDGIDTYLLYNCVGPTVVSQWAKTEVAQYKALGANAIGIGFPLYTDSLTSNNIYAKDVCNNVNYQSPPASILAVIVQTAHAAGLKVLIRPLLDQTNLSEENPSYWRGVIKPSNLKTWFHNYLATLKPYLQMAQANHVEYFALQTELDSIARASNWISEISLSHAIYKGALVWDYSWKASVGKIARRGTTFAIDAYPQLHSVSNAATPSTLAADWGAVLKQGAYKVPAISATTIDEIGIPAQDGAYANPSQAALPLSTHPFNQAIQANWFSGACLFMKQHHMHGIFFWGPYLNENSGALLTSPDPNRSSNFQPKAQTAIKHCF